MRKLGSGSGKNTITATPRQLESIIRLAEARARLRFSKYVEDEDIEEAIDLIKVATQQAATDPTTGIVDMNLLNTGMATNMKEKVHNLAETVKLLLVK